MSEVKIKFEPCIKRIPRSDITNLMYTITDFEEFLQNETYLFLRTHDAEGHYKFNNKKSSYGNVALATVDFLQQTLTAERLRKLKEFWSENFQKDNSFLVPAHSYFYMDRSDKEIIVKLSDTGSNLMSLISSIVFEHHCSIDVDYGFRQVNKVTRNASSDLHRFSFQVGFEGNASKDVEYVVFDDHIKTGSTVSNLAGLIDNQGGIIKAFMALSANPIVVSFRQTDITWSKLSSIDDFIELNDFWQFHFGYPLEALTDTEAKLFIGLKDTMGNSIQKKILEYKDSPEAPVYPKPIWWAETIAETEVIDLSTFDMDKRLIVIPANS